VREQLEGCLVTLLVIFTIPALIFIAIIYGVYAFLAVFVTFLAIWIAIKKYRKLIANKREEEIRLYVLPAGLLLKLIKKHPTLSLADAQLVDKAMRQYFMAYHLSGHRHVAMPSEVVDDLWHEFILYTQNYARFCKAAFGKFFHHIPAVPLQGFSDAPDSSSAHQAELVAIQQQGERTESLRRTWWFACQQEYIYPKKPHKLPLLFAIDMELNIVNGRKYALDCHTDEQLANAGGTCCVGDFSGSGSGCGGGSGCSGGFSDAAGGGDGGGSDGGGCGGGCGGGGD